MRDWHQFVRDRLELPGVRHARGEKIVEDLARQLEDFYHEGLSRGMTEAEADRFAVQQVRDWASLTSDLLREERPNRESIAERLAQPPSRKMTGGMRMLSELRQDTAYALRMMRKSPVFTAVAVLSLALGIGANVTVFSWIETILFNPFPGVDVTDELFYVIEETPRGTFNSVSYPDYVDYRERSRTTAGIVVTDDQDVSLLYEGDVQRVFIENVSSNYFDVLEVRPHRGRLLQPEDEVIGGPKVVVLSHDIWVTRFGADPDIVGKIVRLNTKPYEVIGVAAAGFQGTETGLNVSLWAPITTWENGRMEMRGSSWMNILVRPKPGFTPDQVAAELTTISRNLEEEYPKEHRFFPALLYPLWNAPVGANETLGPMFAVLMVITMMVLLIACANLANLLLARATARRKEIAVRLSLGAGRGRVLRQILTESILLAIIGGALGGLMTIWTSKLLLTFIPTTDMPIKLAPPLNTNVLLFAFAISVATGLLFGLAPGLQAGRTDLLATLNEESTRASGGRRRAWLRSSLVVAQVALSAILLVTAGLFLRSLHAAQAFDPGFNTENVLVGSFDMTQAGYTPDSGRPFLQQLRRDLQAMPGVESVSISRRLPLASGGRSSTSIVVEGYEKAEGEDVFATYNHVSADFIGTLQIPLLEGRGIAETDVRGEPMVVVINQTMAARYWKDGEALGASVRVGQESLTVVGIVGDIAQRELNRQAQPFMYLPLQQWYTPRLTAEIRTAGEPTALAAPTREVFRKLNPALPLFNLTDYRTATWRSTFQQRMLGNLLSVFGLLALVLASVGIYGVLAYSVGQRSHEIGIRMALGAQRGQILGLVLRQGAWLVGIGLVLGSAAAAAVMPLAAGMLLGVSPTDPATFFIVGIVLVAVAGLACLIPARRAARVEPIIALRYE